MKYELKELSRDVGRLLFRFISNRILWLFVVAAVLFYILLVQLFRLQIVMADNFVIPPPQSRFVTRPVAAQRGTIYDRHGRPLAVNVPVFVAKIDPSVDISNEALLELALLLERNGERFVDDFPISEEPFEFTFTGPTEANVAWQEFRWKDDMAVPNPHYATAEETWNVLRETFRIDPELCNEDARRIMNLRAPIFRQRLHNWAVYMPTPFTIAYEISSETKAAIEERNLIFDAVFVDIISLRYYPAGRYVSHMVGYLRPITAQQLEMWGHRGYTGDDLFGRAGLELAMEGYLRGTPGQQTFEVNNHGRRIGATVWDAEPEPGNRVFLTIDLELQKQAFHILEGHLAEVLIRRLRHTGGTVAGRPADRATPQEAFISFMRGHNLDIRAVMEAEADNLAFPMRQHITARFPGASSRNFDAVGIQGMLIEGLERGHITPAEFLLTLIGTEQISDPDGIYAERLQAHTGTRAVNIARDILIHKIEKRELTPHMIGLDPVTGSAVVTCIDTGDVLAAVSYPSFDNNRLVNDFDNDYFRHINLLDPTHPMINRPFMEAIAPGSTFKMFTAVAALEEGSIGPTTRIFDGVRHTASGIPSVNCWHSGGHGSIPVCTAIAVSCNFFFAESAFRLGNSRHPSRNTMDGITTLNRYMEFFGLNDPTGVEIGEIHQQHVNQGYLGNTMASPEFKIHRGRIFNPNASLHDLRWRDGDTAQVSIGQGYNAYTPAQMARGMAIIANRGTNYPLRLVSQIENYAGTTILRNTPTPLESDIDVSDSTWDVVHRGMLLVTEPGAGGTGISVFRNFPVRVAGKTGTAEQIPSRFSHTAFGAFAPYENPQIAIYVNVPFSATRARSQSAAHVSRDIIGAALGIHSQPQRPGPLNTLRH
ncbi:MAG: penicillin-binding transpeptidase domain-containing protein [Defluviitaleaceae bacterium]|nr:penicillin-binding transpeptidase domain-containing protein [Defluviitaleaceae bacterium]